MPSLDPIGNRRRSWPGSARSPARSQKIIYWREYYRRFSGGMEFTAEEGLNSLRSDNKAACRWPSGHKNNQDKSNDEQIAGESPKELTSAIWMEQPKE